MHLLFQAIWKTVYIISYPCGYLGFILTLFRFAKKENYCNLILKSGYFR